MLQNKGNPLRGRTPTVIATLASFDLHVNGGRPAGLRPRRVQGSLRDWRLRPVRLSIPSLSFHGASMCFFMVAEPVLLPPSLVAVCNPTSGFPVRDKDKDPKWNINGEQGPLRCIYIIHLRGGGALLRTHCNQRILWPNTMLPSVQHE